MHFPLGFLKGFPTTTSVEKVVGTEEEISSWNLYSSLQELLGAEHTLYQPGLSFPGEGKNDRDTVWLCCHLFKRGSDPGE